MADGSRTTECKAFVATVQLGEKYACIPFLVLPTVVDEVILGIDFLCAFKAALHCGQVYLQISPGTLTTPIGQRNPIRAITASQDLLPGWETAAIGVDDASTTHAKITRGAGATRAATEMITSGLEQITSWGPLEDGEPSQRPHPFGGTTDGIHDLPAKQQKHREDHPFGGTTDGIHDLPAKQQKHREDHPFGGTTDEVHDLPATSTTMAEVQDPNTGTQRNEYQDPSGGTSKPRMIATNGLDNAPMTITQANNQEAKTGQVKTTTEVCSIAIPQEMEPHVNEAEDDDESKPRTKQAEEPGLEPWVRKFLESELAQF
ncbi:hypothetical protein ACLKA7_000127 [Drosophila subpalustris]